MPPDISQRMTFEATSAVASLTKLEASLRSATGAIAAMKKVATGDIKLGDVAKVANDLNGVTKSAARLKITWGTMLRVVQTQIIVRGLAALNRALREGVQESITFRIKLAEIQTIGRSLGMSTSQLSSEVLDLAAALGKSQEDVAEGLYQTLSNQVVKASEATGFLIEAEKLSVVTAAETKDAVNALSSVMNSYGMAASEAGHVSDTLFKTVELGRLRLADMASIIGRVTPMTAKMGIAWEEVAASIAVMTRQGVRADTAITQLRAVVQKILKPTKEMKRLFHEWGVRDGKEAIQTFGGLTGVLKKLSQETGGSSSEMARYFRRVRAIVGVMGIMSSEGDLVAKTMEEIKNSTGAASEAFKEFEKMDAFQIKKSYQELKNAILEVATAFQPLISATLQATAAFADNIKMASIWARGELQARAYEKAVKDAFENIEKASKKAAKSQAQDFTKIDNASRRYLNALQKQWFQVNESIARDTQVALNGLKSSLSGMSSGYSAAVQKLKKFAQEARSEIEKLEAAGNTIKANREERNYQRKLRHAKDYWSQEKVRASRQSKFERDARAALTSKDLSDQNAKEALAKIARARQIQSARELAAEQAKDFKGQRDAISNFERLDKLEMRLRAKMADQHEVTAKAAREELHSMELKAAKVKELTKYIEEQAKIQANASDKKSAEAASKNIKRAQSELNSLKFEGLQRKLLESIGIPASKIDEINKQLSTGLELNITKFQLNLEQIQQTLNARTFTINVLAKTKEVGKISRQLGIETGKNPIENQTRAYEKGKQVLAKYNEALREKAVLEQKAALAMKAADQLGAKAAKAARPSQYANTTRTKLIDMYKSVKQLKRLAENGRLATGQIAKLQSKLKATAKGAPIFTGGDLRAAMNDLIALTDQLQKVNDLKKESSKQTSEFDPDTIEAAKRAVELFRESGRALQDANTSAQDVTSSVQGIGTSAAGSVAGVSALTVAMNQLAVAASQAAQAQASVHAAKGGLIRHYAAGGNVRGIDTIPAMLSPGEVVMNAGASNKFFSELNAMNQGSKPAFRERGGAVTNVGDINVSVSGGDSTQQTVREIGNALRREIKRGTIKLS